MSVVGAIDGHFRPVAPAERLATVRLLVGAFGVVYLLVRAPVMASFSHFTAARFEPVGTAMVLSGPLPEVATWLGWAVALVSGVGFTLGLRFRITGPLFGLSLLWVTSYRNSWGMIFHTDNLLVVDALALGLCPAAAHALSLDRRGQPAPEDDARYGWPLQLLCWMAIITYVIAGLAKVRNSGWEWADGEILRNYIAYDGARKHQLGSIHSPLGALMVQYAWPFPIIGALTLVLELGAPLSMLHRRLKLWWVAGVYGFHLGVLLTMAIAFPYPLSGIAFAPFFAAERLWQMRRLAPLAWWLRGGPAGDLRRDEAVIP